MSRKVTWDNITLEPTIGTGILDAADAAYAFTDFLDYQYSEVTLKFNDIFIKVRDVFVENSTLKTKTLRPAEIVRVYDKGLKDSK